MRRTSIVSRVCGLTICTALTFSPAWAETELTIDRLYTLPSLIGTAPSGFSWSPDGTRLAYLHNDSGYPFRDVWVADVKTFRTSRWTRLNQPQVTGAGDEALRQQAEFEQHSGVDRVLWHPDGEKLLLLVEGRLVLASADGTLQQLESRNSYSQPSFSPDGSSLLYRVQGNLWISPTADLNSSRQLTHLESSVVERYQWSPDSKEIAFVSADHSDIPQRKVPDYLQDEVAFREVRRPYPGEPTVRRRVARMAASGGVVKWLERRAEETEPIWSFSFSPDGKRLLIDQSDFLIKERRLVVVDIEENRAREVYRETNPRNVSPSWQAEWAPDGSALYFLSDRDGYYHVYRLLLGDSAPRAVTRGEWEVARFEITPDGETLHLVANKDQPQERHLLQVRLPDGQVVRLSQRSGTHQPWFSPQGEWAAVHFSSDTTPPELLLTHLRAGGAGEIRLTHSPLKDFANYQWVRPSYVKFRSHVDGTELHGRLTLPPDFDPSRQYPAIIGSVYSDSVRNQWGGRTAHPTWGLDQYLAHRGYVLLNVNIRGSWGHGRTFREGLFQGYGVIDIEDLHSGVKYLRSQGFVDMDRIGIWGSSYGGLMTCMSLFRKPGVYRAGVAGAPATNVWHAFPEQMWVMMQPADHPEKFARSSAFTAASGLEDPLMIIHGMRDSVVFFQDTLRLVQRLIELEKDFELVTLPDAGHGWDNEGLAQTRFSFRKLVGFFDHYLKPDTNRKP